MKVSVVAACLILLGAGRALAAEGVPHYDHIFVMVGENKGFAEMKAHADWAPNLTRLAARYGLATQFYAEVHPSEPNYIAMLGGDTFGIHDDDGFACKPGVESSFCAHSGAPGYADHAIAAKSLMDQLSAHHLSWKGYFQALPAPGSLAVRTRSGLYAAKHNAFLNFKDIQDAPVSERASHLVDFKQLDADLASGDMPNFAEIIPDQCDDMHGLSGLVVPEGCRTSEGLIRRGDAAFGRLVDRIMASPVWRKGNTAIVITFDEDDGSQGRQGCCGSDPSSAANFGGGRIMTLVIANHGPRHLADPTPYNHYSLLRTVEDAFGIEAHLGHAADRDKGVVPMTPLFALSSH